MRLKNLALAFSIGLAAVSAQASFADSLTGNTLTLEGTGGETAGNDYVYPYYLSYDGSSQTTPMMCINYDDTITFGETWYVQGQEVSTSSSAVLQEDAYLFSLAGTGTYTDAQLQLAAWYLGAPDTVQNGGWNADVEMPIITAAQGALPTLTNSFLNNYTLLSPTSDETGWTQKTPQSMLVETSAVTPEPSSLLLLGTGLSAASLFLMRRRAIQEQGN